MLSILKYYVCSAFFIVNSILAQDSRDGNIEISMGDPEWFTYWWVWAAAAALFTVVILTLLTRGKRMSSRMT